MIKLNREKEGEIIENVRDRLGKAESKKISIVEGGFATVQTGFGDNYIAPFALAINSSNSQVALLSSIPNLLGPLSQLFGSKLMEKCTRKRIVLFAVLVQALMWLPIIAFAFLFWKGVWTGALPILLIVFFSVYAVFANLGSPAWFSWMGDIVEEKERGRYFSRRNLICGIISIVCTIIAAFFLDFFKKHDFLLLGFVVFFFLAMCARLVSRKMFKFQYEPPIRLNDGYYFSLWQFAKKAPFNNFGRFTLFRTMLSLVTNIAAPFFVVYMLRNLQFSYVSFMLVTISSSTFSLLFVRLWGKFSDKFGNYKVMRITSILVSLLPILWLFSKSPYYLALAPELISGLGWSGFNLAAGNYIYDCVTPQRRALVVSYYNILNGIAIFFGAAIGAILVKFVQLSFIDTILLIFIISGVGRLLVSLFMLPAVKEVRCVKKFDSREMFRKALHPLRSGIFD